VDFRLNNWVSSTGYGDERANRSLALLREAADAIAESGSVRAAAPTRSGVVTLPVLFDSLPPNSVWERPAVACALLRRHGANAAFLEGVVREAENRPVRDRVLMT